MKITITKSENYTKVKTVDGTFSFAPVKKEDDLNLDGSGEIAIEKLLENVAENIRQNPTLIIEVTDE